LEIGRRTDVVGIFPNDRSAESLALVLVDEDEREPEREEVRALQPA
jgi:transposase-like protein